MNTDVAPHARLPKGAKRDARRMAGIEHAAVLLGGQVALAGMLGIGVRLLRQKICAERPIRDDEIRRTTLALSVRAREISALAEKLAALVNEGDQ